MKVNAFKEKTLKDTKYLGSKPFSKDDQTINVYTNTHNKLIHGDNS